MTTFRRKKNMKKGKKHVDALQQVDRTNLYSIQEAVALMKS